MTIAFLKTGLNQWFLNLSRIGKKKYSIHEKIDINTYAIKGKHVFCGYYDISPFSENGNILLAHAVSIKSNPEVDDAELLLINNSKKNIEKIGSTKLWCWQQGSRLQWIKNNKYRIFYNNLINENYCSVFLSDKPFETIKYIKQPIYDITLDGKYGIGLNFSRLQRLRPGYGYSRLKDETKDIKIPNNDGVFLIDIESEKIDLIFSLEDAYKLESNNTMDGAEHYFNHLKWSPSSERFLFFHIWINNNTRYSRAITVDKYGNNPEILTDCKTVSHYYWVNNSKLILTVNKFNDKVCFYIIDENTKEKKYLRDKIFNQDGHPSICYKRLNIILCDTYPDKKFDQSLFLYDLDKEQQVILGKFYSPLKYRSLNKCDLHPRFSHDGKKIVIDSSHTGNRTISVLSMSEELTE